MMLRLHGMTSSPDLAQARPPQQKQRKRLRRKLGRHLDIMIYRAYAGLKADQSKNYAGSVWFFLDPILSASVYITIGNFLKHQTPDFTVFVIVGSFVWQ